MSDEQRVDALFARLMADPNFQTFAVLLGPYRAMMGASTTVELIEEFIEHWRAVSPEEIRA